MAYKYHTAQEYHQLILETEREIDRQAELAEEARQLAALEAYINDPRNANEVNNHPVVKALRQTPASPGWGPPAPPRPATQPAAQPGRLPAVIPADAHFKPSDLKLLPVNLVDSIKDPLVMSPGATVRQR